MRSPAKTSCGGHFRTEFQDSGEAKSDDAQYAHAAVRPAARSSHRVPHHNGKEETLALKLRVRRQRRGQSGAFEDHALAAVFTSASG